MLKKIKKIATKTEIGEKAVTDKQFRAGVFACGSLLINLAYAVYNGFTGIKQSSSWYIAIFAYYAVLAVMRFYVVSYEFKKTTKRTDRNIMRFCGRMLIVLAAVLVATVALGVLLHQDTSKPVTMMIVTAVYTFWKAIYAVVKIIRAAKDGAPVLLALRNISCADAAASMLSLEHAMLYTFSAGQSAMTNVTDILTGAAAVYIVLILGISLLTYRIEEE